MQNTNNTGGDKKIDIGIQKHFLNHLNLAPITRRRWDWAPKGRLMLLLLGIILNARHYGELPLLDGVQGNAQWNFVDSGVELYHMVPKLPETIEEESRIIPA